MNIALDVLAWLFTGVCAVIPDPLEAWLAGGGNIIFILVLLGALGVWQLTKAGGVNHGRHKTGI